MKFKFFSFLYTVCAIFISYTNLSLSLKLKTKNNFDLSSFTKDYSHFAESLLSNRGIINT